MKERINMCVPVIDKKAEAFKVRYSKNGGDYQCYEKDYDIWFNYKDAKKIFDSIAHPKEISADTIEWVELSYFPEGADDETIIEEWELAPDQKFLKKMSQSFKEGIWPL